MPAPKFQIGDYVRVTRTGPEQWIAGIVRDIDVKSLGARTNRGPRYFLEVNGQLYPQPFHEIDLVALPMPARV
jgi:hypothetical protein